MNKNRFFVFVVASALVIGTVMVAQAYNPSSSNQAISQSMSGTGEQVRFILGPPGVHTKALESRYTGSDWIERHPYAAANVNVYAGSDWIERHPPLVAGANIYAGSDWIERHPTGNERASTLETGMQENGHTYAGAGDPVRFNYKPAILDPRNQENGHTYAGTGDPVRYQAP